MPDAVRTDGEDVILSVQVQPRAPRVALLRDDTGGLRLRLTAAPADGQANRQAARALADAFGVPPSGVTLERGARGRRKRFRVHAPRRWPEALAAVKPARVPPVG